MWLGACFFLSCFIREYKRSLFSLNISLCRFCRKHLMIKGRSEHLILGWDNNNSIMTGHHLVMRLLSWIWFFSRLYSYLFVAQDIWAYANIGSYSNQEEVSDFAILNELKITKYAWPLISQCIWGRHAFCSACASDDICSTATAEVMLASLLYFFRTSWMP